MKSIAINLDPERVAKPKALSDSTAGHTTQIGFGDLAFSVQERKLSASAIAIGLLNAAIDKAHDQLP